MSLKIDPLHYKKMGADIIFLEKVLNQSLSSNNQPTVVVKPLFEFMEEIIQSPPHKQNLNTFMEKWRSCLHKSSQKMMLVTIKGTWPPSCLDKKQLLEQPTWKDFIGNYDKDFVECTVNSQNSPDYQPLNFSELIRQTFWKEIYENFGNKIVIFLFDKCAILYETDEGLYLIIAHSKSPIYKKISRFQSRKIGKTIAPFEYKYSNPYQLTDQKKDTCATLSVDEGNGDLATNKNKDCGTENQVYEDVGNGNVKELRMKRKKLESLSTNQQTAIPVNRWISPKLEALKKVIEHRNITLASCNLPVTSTIEQLKPTALRYICIQKDEVFKPEDKLFVIKQKGLLSATKPKISKGWQGLKLPENLIEHADSKGNVSVEVFFISETLAKKLEIRIKPKGRQRKAGSQKGSTVPVPSGSMQPSVSSHSVGGDLSSHSSGRKVLTPVKPDNRNSQNSSNITSGSVSKKRKRSTPASNSAEEISNELFKHVKPYISDYTIPISACLYNKSSWSKWPSSHCLSKAVKTLSTTGTDSKTLAIKTVVAGVLDVAVSCLKASNHLRKALGPNYNAHDSANPLNNIILEIIGAHSKFKDVHKLVKNCITYWHKKYSDKLERKGRKFKDVKAKPLLVDLTDDDKVPSKVPEQTEEIEYIDLAESESIESSSSSSVEILSIPEKFQDLQIRNRVLSKVNSANSSKSSRNLTPASSDFPGNSRTQHPSTWAALGKNVPTNRMNKKRFELVRKCSGNSFKKRSFRSLKHDVPQNCVMQTLKQIFHIMKLELLLGSKRNIRGFFKFVRKAIILGGIKSALHLNEMMAMINPRDMEFLHKTKDRLAVDAFTAKLVTWLFKDYVLVLLKTCFYVTECNFTRFHVRFYLRESWISASSKMKNHLLQNKALSATDGQKRSNAILRYIPKQNQTLRSLLLMKSSVWNMSVDDMKMLKLYLHYIDAKINESRMYLPAALQHKWLKFVSEWKENGAPKLYYLRMDIRDAFPSVSIPKLNDILFSTGSDRGHKILLKEFVLMGSNGLKRFRGSILNEMNREHWHSGIHIRPCIVMDLEKDKPINAKDIFDKVINIINTTNVIRVGKKIYQFNYGLPQGWSSSPTLCSIYYGYIDSTLYLPYLETNGRLFLRVVDDYLFLSPNPNEVLNLMMLMKIGCEKFGIKMNEEKSETNVFVKSNAMSPTSNCETVTFCGWNFCVICGHVSRDYKKYSGQDFTSTIGFQMSSKVTSPEQFIHQRATVLMPARLEPIVLNTTINCNKRILVTIFEASIVLAFRFYAICRVVYPNLIALDDDKRVEAVKETIYKCLTKLARHVARSCEGEVSCKDFCCGLQNISLKDCGDTDIIANVFSLVSISASPVPVKGVLSFESLLYTSLLGFRLKLSNHSGVFGKILGHLNCSILKLREKLGNTHCDNVIRVVGTKIPACLSGIKI